MNKISVVLATFNEEKNIGDCLQSIKELADEIIIVDGTSSDETVAIAKEHDAKVIIVENKQIFHINKQIAIDNATKDWILQLDADERVSNALRQEIKERIVDSKINGYWLPRKNWFLGRFLIKGGQYPDYTLRLYRKGKGRLPQKDVHEQAVVEGDVAYLKQPLLHYPYKDFHAYLLKWRRYVAILSVQITEELRKKDTLNKLYSFFDYLIIKPIYWFLLIYIRHKGFVDLWPGFVFALFSALRFPVAYFQYLTKDSK